MHRLTAGLLALRAVSVGALVLLLWNPVSSRLLPAAPPQRLVLLDASLSMATAHGAWRGGALDTARALAREGGGGTGIIWRFGDRVASFDSAAPDAGASRLRPALEAAAARGGSVVVVTDGELSDVTELPPDLVRRARVIVLPRPPFFDAFVAAVTGPRRVSAEDTIRLRVSYGAAGTGDGGRGTRKATLVVSVAGRRLTSRQVPLPDSGIVSTTLTLPPSLVPRPGWQVLEVRLEGVSDAEPRDDARLFVVEVSREPAAVILAAPPDWESRFLGRTLRDVARLPLKVFVQTEADGGARWRDAATLAPVARADVERAVAAARLVVLAGDPARHAGVAPRGGGAVLTWPAQGGGQEGDWYVEPPPASPLAAALTGIAWDSLPPASAVMDFRPASDAVVALTARLARRGPARPIVVLREQAGRSATIAASGLWRWAFRGGAAAVAYRSFVAALADWLLAGGGGRGARAVPVTFEAPNARPIEWRWTAGEGGSEPPRDLPITLEASGGGARTDTLRFDGAGHALLWLPPGVYRYALAGEGREGEGGVIAVEMYSDEWRPTPPAIGPQPGTGGGGRGDQVGLRDRWWLFVIALAAFAAEWAWRRRQGLP